MVVMPWLWILLWWMWIRRWKMRGVGSGGGCRVGGCCGGGCEYEVEDMRRRRWW